MRTVHVEYAPPIVLAWRHARFSQSSITLMLKDLGHMEDSKSKVPVFKNFTFHWGREKQINRVSHSAGGSEGISSPTVIQRDHSYQTLAVALNRCHRQERKTPRKRCDQSV